MYKYTTTRALVRDVLSGRVTFTEACAQAPAAEVRLFLNSLNNAIGEEFIKTPSAERKAELKELDELTAFRIEALSALHQNHAVQA